MPADPERLLADWAEPPGDPEPTLGSCAPSGWLALDLDTATDDPARSTTPPWSRRWSVSTGSPRGRPPAKPGCSPNSPRGGRRTRRRIRRGGRVWAASTSPTRSGWLCIWRGARLVRGSGPRAGCSRCCPTRTRCGRRGFSTPRRRGRSTTPPGCCPDDLARAVQGRVLSNAPEQTLAQLKAALARAVLAVDPEGAEAGIGRRAGTGGWWSPRRPTGWRRCGRCSPQPRRPGRSPG